MKRRHVWEVPGWACAVALFSAGVLASSRTVAAPTREEALTLGAHVADWQLDHMSRFDYVPLEAHRRDTESPRDWVQAAFYIGLSRFADASGVARYAEAVLAHGAAEAWGFDDRPRHADADATGAVWVWAAERTHDPAKLIPCGHALMPYWRIHPPYRWTSFQLPRKVGSRTARRVGVGVTRCLWRLRRGLLWRK